MSTVKLKHAIAKHGKRIEHFYDGMLPTEDGMIEVPADREHWIKRLWVKGYNLSPSGKRLWTWRQVLEEIQEQNTVKQTPKKKAAPPVEAFVDKEEDADEGADSGRQPED